MESEREWLEARKRKREAEVQSLDERIAKEKEAKIVEDKEKEAKGLIVRCPFCDKVLLPNYLSRHLRTFHLSNYEEEKEAKKVKNEEEKEAKKAKNEEEKEAKKAKNKEEKEAKKAKNEEKSQKQGREGGEKSQKRGREGSEKSQKQGREGGEKSQKRGKKPKTRKRRRRKKSKTRKRRKRKKQRQRRKLVLHVRHLENLGGNRREHLLPSPNFRKYLSMVD
jgi:hypothetical protein